MNILITSGGTKVPIDRVRSITNMSRGTFGSKIADAFFKEGLAAFNGTNEKSKIEKITFFMAKGSRLPVAQTLNEETFEDGYRPIEYVEYSTFDEYKDGLEKILKKDFYEIIVAAAAVSDYGVKNYVDGKIHSSDSMTIELFPLPKVLPMIRKWSPLSVLCGFKLLVDSTREELIEAMKKQIDDSNVDLVVGNDLRDIKADDHKLLIMRNDESKSLSEYEQASKELRKPNDNFLAESVAKECISFLNKRLPMVEPTKKYSACDANGIDFRYTYGSMTDKRIICNSLKELAYSIAYYYHRSAAYLMIWKSSKWEKADEDSQREFNTLLDMAFWYRESR